jgi:hypothetical protein
MTYGLGMMLRKRLKREGYDISNLQEIHKCLAQRGSVHEQYVTADLSSASDSISRAFVKFLFPPDWFQILDLSRVPGVLLPDGSRVESETFCTMGVGYTFPLQTIVFLSLLKAIQSYLYGGSVRLTTSVYGDDMIYHRSLHSTVVSTFEEIGFVINVDKTYHEGRFRESCGGDYYRGVDVRPFQPRNGAAFVSRKAYEAVLYKFVNGLLTRWSEYEIPETLRYLLSEIGSVTGKAKLVPVNFPDDSGIKVSLPVLPLFLQGRTDVAKPKHVGHGVFRFSFLRLKPIKREEKRHEPYLWEALRGVIEPVILFDERSLLANPTLLQKSIELSVGCRGYEPQLTWAETPDQTVRSKLTGRRLRRMVSSVTVSHTGRYTRQSGTSCFEVPQT